jgi:hypothetical protein
MEASFDVFLGIAGRRCPCPGTGDGSWAGSSDACAEAAFGGGKGLPA